MDFKNTKYEIQHILQGKIAVGYWGIMRQTKT